MDKKKIGVALLTICMIASMIFGAVSTKQAQTLKKENEVLQEASPHGYEERISALTDDLAAAQEQLQAVDHNTETEVREAAEYYLTTYYDNENSTTQEQLDRVKALMSEQAYKSLQPDDGEPEGAVVEEQYEYKTWVTDLQSYYRFTSDSTAEILIYCTLHVQSGEANTSSPYLFSARMQYVDSRWIVDEIHESRTVRADN